MRVRTRTFRFTDRPCVERPEITNGATVLGDVSTEKEGNEFGDKLLARIGKEYARESVLEAMLSIASEIAAAHSETIGPPYFSHTVTRAGNA